MTKKSFFLFSTLILAGLAQAPSVAATTETSSSSSAIVQETKTPTTSSIITGGTVTNEAAVAKPTLVVQQTDTALRIGYNRSANQSAQKIYYAIWSNENGQDDIKWYLAGDNQTDIPLNKLGNSGAYSIHAYITIDGKSTFLTSTVTTITQTTPLLKTSISPNGFLTLNVSNLPASTAEVLLPTWSDNNGQDDVRWYTASRNADGTATVTIPLKQHNFETGIYHTHFYIKDSTGNRRFISSAQTTISSNQLPTLQDPVISIQSLDSTRGTYQVRVQEQAATKPIKTVEIATWSTSNQSNLKWRTATNYNGTYLANVSFQEHQNHTGQYQNHIYVTYADGSKAGFVTKTVDLSQARLPATIQTSFVNVGNFKLTVSNVSGTENVRYAVWSEEGGQDDLHWYNATKTGTGTYTGNIPLVVHNSNGTYHLHVYQGNIGLGTTTFQVAENQRTIPVTTYEVGECTWGAKTLAPWAGDYWGNGEDWAASARSAGFRVGTTPQVGAIAVWSGDNGYGYGYGHVAVVVDVQSNSSIRVKESNYGRNRYIGDFRGWFNPIADGVTSYIYPN